MKRSGQSCFFIFIAICLLYILVIGVGPHVVPKSTASERLENAQWIATGSWWDRQICRWFELCGAWHMVHKSAWKKHGVGQAPPDLPDFASYWTMDAVDPSSWSKEERRSREIPEYVFEHAPYVHLFSEEEVWPSDIAEHLAHTTPFVNYTAIESMKSDRNLSNLADLNNADGMDGRFVYLQSNDNAETHPTWLTSEHNIPVMAKSEGSRDWRDTHAPIPAVSIDGRCGANTGVTCEGSSFGQCCSTYGWCGSTLDHCMAACDPLYGACSDALRPPPATMHELRRSEVQKRRSRSPCLSNNSPDVGRSSAPAILIVVNKGDGVLDAFWFFFYSFNLGQKVLGIRFGNHVGDWEHTMIRFRNGTPEAVFFSEHDFGDAYTWAAVEKYAPHPSEPHHILSTIHNATSIPHTTPLRPVIFSAVGSHAMYATPGLHPYILPFGMLHDETDRGPLWDPTLNVRSFVYDPSSDLLKASMRNPRAPTGWFHYTGRWGDKYYPLGDARQYRFVGQYHYVNGPTGPRDKRLDRAGVCQNSEEDKCGVKGYLGDGGRPKEMKVAGFAEDQVQG